MLYSKAHTHHQNDTEPNTHGIGLYGSFLVFVFATIPIEIVNFIPGAGFSVTPFIILSPIIIAIFAARTLTSPSQTKVTKDALYLMILAGIVIISSLAKGPDPLNLSTPRALLISWMILFSIAYTSLIKPNIAKITTLGIKLFLLIHLAFTITQGMIYFELLPSLNINPTITLQPWSIAGSGVRFNGAFTDPNRAGVTILIMSFILFLLEKTSHKSNTGSIYYILAGVMIIATLSRTAIAAMIISMTLLQVANLLNQRKRISQSRVIINLALITGALIGINYSYLQYQDAISALFWSSEARTESTNIHFELIKSAVEISTSSIKNLILGTGWGTSYHYTEQFFGGDKYGNFHNGFLSLLAQSGIFAIAIYTIYLLRPIITQRETWWIIPGIIFANVFYEFSLEAIYWVLLLIMNSSIFIYKASQNHEINRHHYKYTHPRISLNRGSTLHP